MTNEEKAKEFHEQIKHWQREINNLQDMIDATWKRIDELDPNYFVDLLKIK